MGNPSKKRVAIIGAGVGGLLSIKSCLEEGLAPVCFEKLDKIGGLWYHTKEYIPGQGCCVYDDLSANISKEMMCFSDFPFPPETPAFPRHDVVHKYIQDYAKKFDLVKYVRFCTVVAAVNRSHDHDDTGKWEVTYLHRPNMKLWEKFDQSDLTTETFDAVMLCCGSQSKPNRPHFNGEEGFKGPFLHSMEYRSANSTVFHGKRVLVVGNAHSAGDVAVSSSQYAKQTIISIGRGTWIFPKTLPNGLPVDTNFRRIFQYVPKWAVAYYYKKHCNTAFDHQKYKLAPQGDPLRATIMVNNNIGEAIKTGRIQVKPMLIGFRGNIAMFNDGTEEEVDSVVVATGFEYDYSYIDINTEGGEFHRTLYRQMWPSLLKHPTLAVIALILARGSVIPSIELQTRWAVRVFTGQTKLPDSGTMLKEADERTRKMIEWFGRDRLFPAPNGIIYQDQLADEIGAKPSFFKLFFSSPYLAYLCYFGPAYAVQYRLRGPHKWTGAPAAVKAAFNNTILGSPKYMGTRDGSTGGRKLVLLTFLVVSVVALICLCFS